MIAGARKGRTGSVARLRDADAVDAKVARPSEVELRLALAKGALGIELGRPFKLGAIELTDLHMRLSSVRFPVDLSGGVRRFRHVRGELTRMKLELPLFDGSRAFEPRFRALFPAPELTLAACRDGIVIGLATDASALAFDVIAAPLQNGVRLMVENARGISLPDAAHTMACRALSALLGELADPMGSAFLLRDPFGAVCREILPRVGARAPATRELHTHFEIVDDGRSGRVAIWAGSEEPAAQLSARVVRALETVELCAEADTAAIAGDREFARRAYLSAIEKAPRHPEAVRRLAALDASFADRNEAALATLIDLGSATDAGLLGAEVLAAMGEREAAYVAAVKAASEEPYGRLAAHAWLYAAELSDEYDARQSALDTALSRAPGLAAARWARVELALAHGEVKPALGDVAHLEAAASGRDNKHATLRRAAELFLSRGLAAESEKLFERALRWEPKSSAAVAGLARALRDRGKHGRALDLLSRAVGMAATDAPTLHDELSLELAESLAAYANDRPAAVARAAAIAQDAPMAPRARLAEARWRADLGDLTGASRALARLRAIAEVAAERGAQGVPRETADLLVEAAAMEQATLHDVASARHALSLALRLAPNHGIARRALAAISALPTDAAAMPAAEPVLPAQPQVTEPVRAAAVMHSPAAESVRAPFDEASAELRVEELSNKLRGDPNNAAISRELADILERLGRDLDLLALLSARVDEAPPDERPEWLQARKRTLLRMAASARAEGRSSEAELYESMAN